MVPILTDVEIYHDSSGGKVIREPPVWNLVVTGLRVPNYIMWKKIWLQMS